MVNSERGDELEKKLSRKIDIIFNMANYVLNGI